MSLKERVKLQVEVDVDVAYLAEQFAALSDDAQAQFFCIAAGKLGTFNAGMQAFYIGKHLRTCECSTDDGRAFIREIVASMELP